MKTKKKKIIVLSCVIASVILGAIGSFFAFGGAGVLNGEAVAAVSNGAFDATPTDETPTRTISISDLTMSGTNTHIYVREVTDVTLSNCEINGPSTGNCSNHAIIVTKGGQLTLSNTTVSGWNTFAAVYCGYNSCTEITMESGSIITNNSGGGVYVSGNAEFTMSGGVITGNTSTYGGGIYNEGSLTISGGEIYGNTSTYGGGVYSSQTVDLQGDPDSVGTVTMSGGIIHDNTATNTGGGVCVAGGSFEMTAGQIYHNSAENGNEIGTMGNGASIRITGGTISPTAPSGGSFLPDFDANYSQTNENGFDYLLGETVLVPNNSGVAVVFEEEKTE